MTEPKFMDIDASTTTNNHSNNSFYARISSFGPNAFYLHGLGLISDETQPWDPFQRTTSITSTTITHSADNDNTISSRIGGNHREKLLKKLSYKLPYTFCSHTSSCRRIKVSLSSISNTFMLHQTTILQYNGMGHAEDAGTVKTSQPIPSECGIYYFEISIKDKGHNGEIAIGLCTRNSDLSKLPGWERSSYGYHGDDGKKFNGGGSGNQYSETFTSGDTIGLLLNFHDKTLSFTKNGRQLGVAFTAMTTESTLYPCVGMRTPGVVEANFGQRPFAFDLASYVADCRQQIIEHINNTSIPTHPSLSLASSSLSASGSSSSPAPSSPSSADSMLTSHSISTTATAGSVTGGIGGGVGTISGAGSGGSSVGVGGGGNVTTNTVNTSSGNSNIIVTKEDGTSSASSDTNLEPLLVSLVESYLVHSGFTESAARFAEATGRKGNVIPLYDDMKHRQRIQQQVLNGNIDDAIEITNEYYPQVLADNPSVYLSLLALKFCHCVSINEIDKAMECGKEMMAQMQQLKEDSPSPLLDTNQVFSLLAYEDPKNSPVSHFLSPDNREPVARALNSAIMKSTQSNNINDENSDNSALEGITQQTRVILDMLVELGIGGAAFVSIDDIL